MSRTTGQLVARPDEDDPEDWEVIKPAAGRRWPWYVATCHDGADGGDAKSNAEFTAEAFNVADETGLTPRQLADQRAELLAAPEALLSEVTWELGWNSEAQARAAIAKARGES